MLAVTQLPCQCLASPTSIVWVSAKLQLVWHATLVLGAAKVPSVMRVYPAEVET